jgi:hypothetical protein
MRPELQRGHHIRPAIGSSPIQTPATLALPCGRARRIACAASRRTCPGGFARRARWLHRAPNRPGSRGERAGVREVRLATAGAPQTEHEDQGGRVECGAPAARRSSSGRVAGRLRSSRAFTPALSARSKRLRRGRGLAAEVSPAHDTS